MPGRAGGIGRAAFPMLMSGRYFAAVLALASCLGCYGTERTTLPDAGDGAVSVDSVVPAKENGESCSAPGDCQSGICVDSVCCDKSCSAVCQACNSAAAMGKCSPVISQEESGCQGLQSCDTTGSCTDRFTEFPTPTSASGPLTITTSDSSLWFTESSANKIGRISRLGAIDEYSTPTVASFPFGIAW